MVPKINILYNIGVLSLNIVGLSKRFLDVLMIIVVSGKKLT